jgi:hypothetical protein
MDVTFKAVVLVSPVVGATTILSMYSPTTPAAALLFVVTPDMPKANGMAAVVVCVPSFKMQVDSPVARSAVSALNTLALIVVPATTGWPLVLIENVPALKLIGIVLVSLL